MKKTILWILVIGWALMIFMFSAQPAKESDEVSLSIGAQIIKIVVSMKIIDIPVSSDGDVQIEIWAEQINHFIRKAAHFTIFLILGVLVFLLLRCYKDFKISFILTLAICLLYATSDEIHQLAVPGRAGQIKDVLLDFSGSFLGVILISIIEKLFEKYKIKNNK